MNGPISKSCSTRWTSLFTLVDKWVVWFGSMNHLRNCNETDDFNRYSGIAPLVMPQRFSATKPGVSEDRRVQCGRQAVSLSAFCTWSCFRDRPTVLGVSRTEPRRIRHPRKLDQERQHSRRRQDRHDRRQRPQGPPSLPLRRRLYRCHRRRQRQLPRFLPR